MNNLEDLPCKACNKQSIKLTADQITTLLAQLPHWHVTAVKKSKTDTSTAQDRITIEKLCREFNTKSYAAAVHLTNQIAHIAEAFEHHPEILLEYTCVTVCWWTHTIDGLHENDFIMAAKTSKLFQHEA